MDKKNTEPLTRGPQMMPKQVYAEGDSYRPAGDQAAETPMDPVKELKAGTAQLEEGATKGSLETLRSGVRTVTGIANVLSGADPMRPPRESPTNGDAVPGAYQEVTRFRPVLESENPGIFRRLDLDRLDSDMAACKHAQEMRDLYRSRADQMDRMVRHYDGEAAATLVNIFKGCRGTILEHADLQGRMPELTRLAVGAQMDAAASRAHNDKLRTGAHDGQPGEPAVGTPPPQTQTTTTVTTPAPVPVGAPPVAPPPAHVGKPHKPHHNPKG